MFQLIIERSNELLNNSPATIYISLGTILAAIITGAVSFVNIIISKDQKVSELRQAWIDSFRNDVAVFASMIINVYNMIVVDNKNEKSEKINRELREEFLEKSLEDIKKFLEIRYRIEISLYYNEKLSIKDREKKRFYRKFNGKIELLEKIKILSIFISQKNKGNNIDHIKLDDVPKEVNRLIELSQRIVNDEWRKIRKGELLFWSLKYLTLITFIFMVLFAFVLIVYS